MSHHSQEVHLPVLSASLHDIRYFTALLRGVSFSSKATVTITERGLTVTVEDARTLLGTAFIFAGVFDEYAYNPEVPQARVPHVQPKSRQRQKRKASRKRPPNPDDSSETESETHSEDNQVDTYDPAVDLEQDDEDENPENAAFEIPINTLIECLNIFGTAGPSTGNMTSASSTNGGRGQGAGRGRGAPGGWRRAPDREDKGDSDGDGGRGRALGPLFNGDEAEGKTGMRLSYAGTGYPLTLIIAQEASGPTTTCEITTFEAEPHLALDYDNSKTVLKIILKSSWLRDALSEIDASCEKLTFVGNPPASSLASDDQRNDAKGKQKQRQGNRAPTRSMLRIQASGVFGSTEMDYPNDREVLETFDCLQTVRFSYRFSHILRTIKALQSSTKTSLRIDEDGLLSLQFLMPSPKPRAAGGTDAFIEFRCLCIDENI